MHFPSPENYWLLWIALTFAGITSGTSLLTRVRAILLTSLLTLISVTIASALTTSFVPLVIFIALMSGATTYAAQRYPNYNYPLFLITTYTLIAAYFPTSSINLRAMNIALGISIVLISQIIFLPILNRVRWQTLLATTARQLEELTQEIFTCFLEADYAENKYLFEHRIHVQKNKVLYILNQLKKAASTKPQHDKINQLRNLYILLIDAGQLRNRIKDYSVFQVCHTELLKIKNAIKKNLAEVSKTYKNASEVDTNDFSEHLIQLEDNYTHVLQVAAPDPLAILLFIITLKNLRDELEGIA
jgi:uncharacterized membrane protein YccC